MALVQHEFYKQDKQIGVLGKLLIAWIAPQLVSGMGSLTVFQQAAVSSLISDSLEGIVTGNFDLGKALGNMLFAGVSSYATSAFNLNDHLGLSSKNLLGLDKGTFSLAGIADQFGDSVIRAGLTTVAYGGDFGANLASSFRSGVLNMAMADVQQIIGSRYNDANGKPIRGGEGSLGHVFEHSLAGCFFGELLGSGCQAGALAGAGQAIYAGLADPARALRNSDQFLNNAQLVGGLAAALVTGGDVNATMTAAGIARSGFQNNYLNHVQRAEVDILLAELEDLKCYGKGCSLTVRGRQKEIAARLAELREISVAQTLKMKAACAADPAASACKKRLEEAIAYDKWAGGYLDPRRQFDVDLAAYFDPRLIGKGGGSLDSILIDAIEDGGTGAEFLTRAEAGISGQLWFGGAKRLREQADLLARLDALGGGAGEVLTYCGGSECLQATERDLIESALASHGLQDFLVPMTTGGVVIEIASLGAGKLVKVGGRLLVKTGELMRPATADEVAEALRRGGGAGANSATISSPLPDGLPGAIWRGFGKPNARQQALLDQLQNPGDTIIIPKSGISLQDLAALTAATGDEFAVFTTGGRRMIVRGGANNFGGIIDESWAAARAAEGWRFSAHTHPIPDNVHPSVVMRSSGGDRAILEMFGNENNAIMGSNGMRTLFTSSGDW